MEGKRDMVVSKEKFTEWELISCDIAKANILKEDYKHVEIVQEEEKARSSPLKKLKEVINDREGLGYAQKKEEVRSSPLKKVKEMIKNKEGLGYAIIVNILILMGLIVVISIFIGIGGLLMDPFLIFSVLFMVLLFIMLEIFRLVDKETSCKYSR